MAEKIKIEICCGTTCYMLGAGELLKLEEILPEEWREFVDISAVPCNELCNDPKNLHNAPFITIDGEVYANASLEGVTNILVEKMQKKGGWDG